MLSIIVPHYKESWETAHYLFDSIATQRGINLKDIEVIVVNDGTFELPIFHYPFDVEQHTIEHGGVSKARNYGLDKALGEYVMFCDIDDMFLNNYGLHILFEGMAENPDVITSPFIEEQPKGEGWTIIQHPNDDATFIHGKAYRRDYLLDNNIRFCDELTIHEDGFFNCIALTCAKNKKALTTPFYLWRWNEGSVVRTNPDRFLMRTYTNLMDSRIKICEELKARGMEKQLMVAVAKTVTDAFYDFQGKDFREADNEVIVRECEKAFKKFWNIFKDDFMKVSGDCLGECLYLSRAKAYTKGFRVEKETLTEFVKRVVG